MDHGIVDCGLAKRKAAERLGVASSGALPSNRQIENCLSERQRIYEPDTHDERIRELRELAYELMLPLAEFEPRLTGAVLSGTATINSAIEVHLFSETIEAVADVLTAARYPLTDCERRYRFGGGRVALLPGFRVPVGDEVAVLPVFPEKGVREPPLSAVDRRPMERVSLRRLRRMLDEDGGPVPGRA